MADEKKEAPRLSPEVKKLNGKSGKRLSQCIDSLCEILDDDEKSTESNEKSDN